MASVISSAVLTVLCFPDITGATIGAYLSVAFTIGTYKTGGIPMGLVAFADSVTVDFNGFLVCTIVSETSDASSAIYTFKYLPSSDLVQIFSDGTELANGATVNITDSVVANPVWNRTTTLG